MKEPLLEILSYVVEQIENSNHEILENVSYEDIHTLLKLADELE